jgi:nicotinamidase-related amidase
LRKDCCSVDLKQDVAMKSENNLHGNAPDSSPVALLLIDVINDLEFDEGDQLLEHALPMANQLSALSVRAREENIPLVYVNDNFGRWRSDFTTQVEHCLTDGVRGEPVAKLLQPMENDYFVLKPKHSGFYSTSLDLLLRALGAQTLILTGIATNICVLFTANDAYMRDYQLWVPSDCSAANQTADHEAAMRLIQQVLKAKVCSGSDVPLTRLAQQTTETRRSDGRW